MESEGILKCLDTAISAQNDQDVIENLKLLIEKADNSRIKEIDCFQKLFEIESRNVQIVAAETVAELCKVVENRRIFTNEYIINKLMYFLNIGYPELTFTTIRALGNICYENEEASELINKVGIDGILAVLRDDSKRDKDNLTIKVSGLLVNLLSTHEDLPKTALKCGILTVVEQLLVKYKESIEDNKILLTFLLSIVNSLTEYFDDKEYTISETLRKTITEIFKASEVPEVSVLCLEIFHPLADRDDIKTALAQDGICELLYDLIEKYRGEVEDEDGRSVMKMACDLIVIILTGDSCMDLLYDEGKGKTYTNMLTWLDSNDSDLLSTGILAIGNFARKDTHCIQMVKNGIATKLIQLLAKYNRSTDINDCKLQHALLSTLKNLVIPKENKGQAIKDNIIEIMYPMLNQERSLVVFKLLGTFRMVIDGQPESARALLSKKDFIERLVYWCYHSDHIGVRGEVPRIFSWLIKNSHSSEPFLIFLSVKDSVKCIVDMIASNHALMQNESFFALNILAIGLAKSEKHPQVQLDNLYKSIVEANFGKNLTFVLNKYGEKWDKHTIENCLALMEVLMVSPWIREDLKDNQAAQSLEKLKVNTNAKERLGEIEKVLQRLNE
ncbi:hypothetical protein ABEB36_014094 [Hypothenemus hampei]|uniref:Rap1 GTPase-GDP dissociation stimulator 1-B n=1 Tax=Hypothenemus hampei TaxID=57062 RepID=A0ABD1E399_HYPHA